MASRAMIMMVRNMSAITAMARAFSSEERIMTEAPEYGSDEYLLKKWARLADKCLSPNDDSASYRLMICKMLENQEQKKKTPLQILAEEGNRDFDV